LFEWEFNRDIVRRISNVLSEQGIYHIWTTLSKYDMPLSNRVQLANRATYNSNHVVYVSIHANAGGGTGWEVFTSKGNTDSDGYAEIFFNEMKSEFPDMTFRADYLDGDSDKEENFYVLRKTICPAVLTENFFMDTYDPDCKILLSDEGREKIAVGHINAINKIYEQLKT
jgi:N-acetylmuramoyl-L-alanine amidase